MVQVNPAPIKFHLENPHEPENNEVIIQSMPNQHTFP